VGCRTIASGNIRRLPCEEEVAAAIPFAGRRNGGGTGMGILERAEKVMAAHKLLTLMESISGRKVRYLDGGGGW